MEKESFDIIYSLGFNCDCASFLKKYNLRSCSGPFDWVGVSNFEQRIDLILKDFQDFLEYHDLERISPLDGYKDAYQNKKTNMSFRHDFDTSKRLDKSFAKVKAKYEKRINRFYKNIENAESILLVYMANCEMLSPALLKKSTAALEAKLGKSVHFSVIQQDFSLERGELFVEEITPKIKSYHLNYYNGVEIIDHSASKLLKRIFTSYYCKSANASFFGKVKAWLK